MKRPNDGTKKFDITESIGLGCSSLQVGSFFSKFTECSLAIIIRTTSNKMHAGKANSMSSSRNPKNHASIPSYKLKHDKNTVMNLKEGKNLS